MSAPDYEMFPITHADGTVIERRADAIRAAIAEGWRGDTCPVCGKTVAGSGKGPHMAAHRRLIGDQPSKTKPKKKVQAKLKPKPKVQENAPKLAPSPVEMPPLSETLAGIIYGYVGPNVPVSMLAEINEWMMHTENLLAALTKETT